MFQANKELTVENESGRFRLLAEQIRKGCQIAPVQCFFTMFRQLDGTALNNAWGQDVYEACVEGAIVLGGGQFAPIEPVARPANGPYADCHLCLRTNSSFILVHLNNDHRWSREKIADWLEAL